MLKHCFKFLGWQRSPKLGRSFYLCCAAEEQGERIHDMPQGVQEYCGRAGNEAWVSQILDYSNVTKSWTCELPSWFISFHAAAQSHLDWGVRTDFRYEHLLLDSHWGQTEGVRRVWTIAASTCNYFLSQWWKNLSYGWLLLLFLKLYNPHWTHVWDPWASIC